MVMAERSTCGPGEVRVALNATSALFPSSPTLPALDWQLPSHSGPYELRIEVQPKSHHRAHYETEGSRGAVKASAGGHPIVQVGTEARLARHLLFWSKSNFRATANCAETTDSPSQAS